MKIFIYSTIQRMFHMFGFHLRRVDRGVSHDSSLEEQLRLVGPSPSVIVEIGAADGRDSAMYAQRCPTARVIAYEPLPENFTGLADRAKAEPRIIAVNAAASSVSGRATFHVTSGKDSSSLKTPRSGLGTYDRYLTPKKEIEVATVRLDDEMRRLGIEKIDLLKMDAQGGELDIINGYSDALQQHAVKVIYSEVCFMPLYESAPLYHDIAARLAALGYRLHGLYNLVWDRTGRLAWGDAIFVPDLAFQGQS